MFSSFDLECDQLKSQPELKNKIETLSAANPESKGLTPHRYCLVPDSAQFLSFCLNPTDSNGPQAHIEC